VKAVTKRGAGLGGGRLGGLGGVSCRADLTSTAVTDAGLKELAARTSLRSVSLDDTKVTGAGVAQFRKALPKVFVAR
jgi:hypothetical protein